MRPRKKYSVKHYRLLIRDDDGSLRELKPKDTLWYALYVNNPPRNNQLKRKFRLRFRMPYDHFISTSDNLSKHEMFSGYSHLDAVGEEPSDIISLHLGVLRYIGCARTLDEAEEANGISRE